MDKVHAFTDGSVDANGTDWAVSGWAYVVVDPERNAQLFVDYDGTSPMYPDSNNVGELEAILSVMSRLTPNTEVVIYSDSEYAIKCLTEWHIKWQRPGKCHWKNAKGQPVANRELIEKCLDQMSLLRVTFVHVKSHGKDPNLDPILKAWNEKVDILAKRGVAWKKGEHDRKFYTLD